MTVSGFMDTTRGWLPVDGLAELPDMGMPGKLWKRIEPDRSMMMTMSRGRCTATAVADALKVFVPKMRPNVRPFCEVTVARTALYGSLALARGNWIWKPSAPGVESL